MTQAISDITYGALVGATDPTRGASNALQATWRLFRAARSADVILTNEGKRSPMGLVLLAALLVLTGQRKLVLSEFLPGTRRGLRGWLTTSGYRLFLPRALLCAQVMTAWEREDYAARYRIAPERLKLIPFYYFDDRVVEEPREWRSDGRTGYLSTGKNSCDWDTVIEAAEGQNWPLTIACRPSEFDQHSEAARHAGIEIRSNIPRAEHDDTLAHSQLLIVALKERRLSAGHVRLMTAATYGTPVIATRVSGIRGYEELAAVLVEPGDAESLRAGVASLMADPDELREQMKRVRSFARSRPYSVYASELRSFVLNASGHRR